MAFLGLAIGLATILLFWRAPFRSALGVASCIIVLLGLSQYYQIDRNAVLGLAIMSVMVIFHNIIVKRRRDHYQDRDEPDMELDLDIDMDQDEDLGAPTPENN